MRIPQPALRCAASRAFVANNRLVLADRLLQCRAVHTEPKLQQQDGQDPDIRLSKSIDFPVPPAVPRDLSKLRDGSVTTSAPNLRETVRHSMRLVTLPIAIITIPYDVSKQEKDSGSPGGLTVSSFNTVSLDAPGGPIVSFNLKLPSQTYDAIQAAGAFDVSLPWRFDIVDTFASSEARNALDANQVRRLVDEHAVFTYQCTWLKTLSPVVADHVIMLGQVQGFLHHDAVDSSEPQAVVKASKMPLHYRAAKP